MRTFMSKFLPFQSNVTYCEKAHKDDHHAGDKKAAKKDEKAEKHDAHHDDHGHDDHAHSKPMVLYPLAFPEHMKETPLTPKQDEEFSYKTYKWGYEAIPISRTKGGRMHADELDQRNHQVVQLPWAHEKRGFHGNEHPVADRINQQYEYMVSDQVPLSGYSGKPTFSSGWEKASAYHHGLYVPDRHQEAKTADDIRLSVAQFTEKANADGPKDACKYLAIEEYRCLQVYQSEVDPAFASRNCFKWFDEWKKCQWDQEKINKGYTYMEDRPTRTRKYLFAPDYKYA